jgi:surface polysaccharide O-acyltransferase-like enzyme
LFRVLGFSAVVLIHTADLGETDAFGTGSFIVAMCRFAVPFFFIATGYFLPRGFVATTTGMAKRLLPPFLAWALFYCWLFNGFSRLGTPIGLVRFLYTGMPGYHLWFLPAMAMAVLIFSAARTRLGWPALFILAALFYLVGMAFGPWHAMLDLPGFGGRNGPFFALMFVTLGAWWKARGTTPVPPILAAALVVTAIGALLAENWILFRMGSVATIAGPDFGVTTILYGAAVFLFALNCRVGGLGQWLARAGPATLGMYLIHILMLMLAQRTIAPDSLGSRLTLAAITVLASALVTFAMMKVPILRRTVS